MIYKNKGSDFGKVIFKENYSNLDDRSFSLVPLSLPNFK